MRCCAGFLVLAAILLAGSTLCRAGSYSSSNPFRSNESQGNFSSGKDEAGNCLTVAEAQKHVGKKNCVTGTVVRVEEGNGGVTFLDFCTDYHSCPFTVVVFRGDLHQVGDVRQLQGRAITIRGTIEEYNERAEIILRHPQQLGASASLLKTAVPKQYDVEREGHYSAGSFRPSKARKAKRHEQDAPVSIEDPEEP
jgi:DNA/RNA endonuclease YhcR with UshA esterase domain